MKTKAAYRPHTQREYEVRKKNKKYFVYRIGETKPVPKTFLSQEKACWFAYFLDCIPAGTYERIHKEGTIPLEASHE